MKREKTIGYSATLGLCGLLLASLPGVSLAETDTRLSDSLRQSLQAQGWQEYLATDGSVIYRQAAPRSGIVNQPDSTVDQGRRQLGEALEDHGWQAVWQADGSLILKPQVSQRDPAAEDRPAAAQSQAERIADLPGFEYWRVERDEDGSVRFHPLASSPAGEAVTADQAILGSCDGFVVQSAQVSLPVDLWPEVNALARQWLTMSGLQGLQVGKVRKILRIYLVSLVRDTAPYQLAHQLAIRASDGRVMLLE
ncbi:MAG: hypothetical protein KZQ95_00485 [Candidatus Thiodiazotropha sp. (ex Epidulcina cf. delphinae)]|nr:hypothetical protein [Candidatus Thiodiazotropha sp. (ex Epidulcina cf. delphinae)]